MQSKRLYFLSTLITILLILFSASNHAAENSQPGPDQSLAGSLFSELALLDTQFFDAFNRCDTEFMATYLNVDFEFYHDLGGLTDSKHKMMNMEHERCGNDSETLRRELVEGSLSVYPLKGYGAIQQGEHRFYLTPKGEQEQLIEIAKFTSVWQQKGDVWSMTRVLSFDHKSPGD